MVFVGFGKKKKIIELREGEKKTAEKDIFNEASRGPFRVPELNHRTVGLKEEERGGAGITPADPLVQYRSK